MPGCENDDEIQDRYEPSQDRRLSTAILDAVEDYRGEAIAKSEFVLYDSVDPEALDRLFRHGSRSETVVRFGFGDVQVELLGDGGVDIAVTDRD